jgi:hypothetical protein
MAMWVIAVVGEASCQCFSLGGNQITKSRHAAGFPLIGPPTRRATPSYFCRVGIGQRFVLAIGQVMQAACVREGTTR